MKLQVCQRLGLEQLENRRAFIRPPTVATLLHMRGPLEAPLNSCVVHAVLRVLSLSLKGKEGRSTFGGVAGILAKF